MIAVLSSVVAKRMQRHGEQMNLKSVAVALALFMVAGCTGPEEHSGKDQHRHQSAKIKIEEWHQGDINPSGDQTDWLSVDLAENGQFLVEFHATEKKTVVVIEVFDRYGRPLAAGRHAKGQKGIVQVIARAKRPGKHFIKLRATDGSLTEYSVRATTGEGSGTVGDTPRPVWN